MTSETPADPSPPTSPVNEISSSPPRAVPTLKPLPINNALQGSAHPLGAVNAARGVRPVITSPSSPSVPTTGSLRAGAIPADMQALLKAFQTKRQSTPATPGAPSPVSKTPVTGSFTGQSFGGGGMASRANRPAPQNWTSAPQVPQKKTSLGQRRGLKLPGGLPGAPPAATDTTATASTDTTDSNSAAPNGVHGSLFNKYSNYVDTETGTLKFAGKAVIHSKGVDFSSGSSFSISLDQIESLDELGKGNYGTVYKVRHKKPKLRVPGTGVADVTSKFGEDPNAPGTGVIMAMKELRLELDDAKFAAIIMELDILHKCVSPYIIDFYGAFFQEGAVYICIEFMDGGSLDKIYGDGVPENVLRKIAWATVMGLKCLKEDHKIIHRDVKPTNILVNSRGEVKICDFGVSGNLVASIAKTNIGCQSYMAPERIASGGMAQPGGASDGTYGVQSDVWSLGLSIIECAVGRYPYPPETYNNIFSQLSAIVDGEPPELPENFSAKAKDFVKRTLHKVPAMRPSYAELLRHPWISDMHEYGAIMEEDEDEEAIEAQQQSGSMPNGVAEKGFPEVREWVIQQMEKRKLKIESGGKWGSEKPALHTVALDQVTSPNETATSEGVLNDSLASLAIKTA